jgi:hypothetical protein
MKKLLLPIFLISSAICHGQINIGQADMPNAGDTLRVSNSSDTLNPLLTGVNYTWDYSYLTPASQWVQKFDAPANFTFPFNLMFNVLNTTYGLKQYTPDSIPGVGIKMGNAYGFYKKASANLKEVGYGLSINSLPIPFTYTPADVIYKFPLTYGSVDSCDSKFGPAVIPGFTWPFYYGQNIHRVNVVDGWGALTTPYGTFQTIRIKTTLAIRDTFADSTGMGFAFSRPLQYEYKWLKQSGKIPCLQVNSISVAGVPLVTGITYRDSIRDSTIQIGIKEQLYADFGLQLFPNPANDYMFIQYSLDNSQDVRIELLDISGKQINILRNSKQSSGAHLEIINLRNLNLPCGTYFVCMYVCNVKVLRRVVVAK